MLPFDQKTGNAAGAAIDIYLAKNDPGGARAVNTAAWPPFNNESGQLLSTAKAKSGILMNVHSIPPKVPHEEHGFQQREHRQNTYERELAFLNKYLKPDAAQ